MSFLSEAWERLFGDAVKSKLITETSKYEKFLDDKYSRVNLIYKKRYADIGDKIVLPMKVNDFIKPMDTLVSFAGASENAIWNEWIQYVSDNFKVNGVLDYWQLPLETNVLKAGDCEDSSIYRVCKLKSNGSGANYFIALGFIENQGHAFPVKIDENGELFVVEATSSDYSPIHLNSSKYKVCYLFNERFSWEIDSSFSFGDEVHVIDSKKTNQKRKNKKVSKRMSAKLQKVGRKKSNGGNHSTKK